MTGKTHIAGGMAACAIVQHWTGVHAEEAMLFIAAGAGGAILPDLCHAGSKIGRRFPLAAGVIRLLFGHRTVTHSLLFLSLAALLLYTYASGYPAIRDGCFIGMISHLILDAATVRGIQLLWPIDLRVRLPLYTRTGSLIEFALFLLLVLTTVAFSDAAVTQAESFIERLPGFPE